MPWCSRWAELKDLALACNVLKGWSRSSLTALLSHFSPLLLNCASSLNPTNGISARSYLLEAKTSGELTGLVGFSLSYCAPFRVCLNRAWQHPQAPHLTPPLHSGWQAFEQAAVLGRGSQLVHGGHRAWDDSLCYGSVARSEMPSLPSCLSNKLSIMGLLNSIALFFHTQGWWW